MATVQPKKKRKKEKMDVVEEGIILELLEHGEKAYFNKCGYFIKGSSDSAWVHSKDALMLKMESLRPKAEYLFFHPAIYNFTTGRKKIIGKPDSFNDFFTKKKI